MFSRLEEHVILLGSVRTRRLTNAGGRDFFPGEKFEIVNFRRVRLANFKVV